MSEHLARERGGEIDTAAGGPSIEDIALSV